MDRQSEENLAAGPTTPGPGSPSERAGVGVVALLGIIVFTGIPFVAILWETLNALLAGHVEVRRLLISVPVLLVFLGILTVAGRALGRLEGSSNSP